MPKRFTITEKWDDKWFRQLSPYPKLLWNFLCDKCDLAGFWEIDLELAQERTGIPKSQVLGAFQGLIRGYLSNGRHIWIRRFIEHQGNLPLNPNNNAHKHIIGLLEKFQPAFLDVDFYSEMKVSKTAPKEELISSTSKGKGISKGKGNSKEGDLAIFEEARKIYPATKRGLNTEFDNFVKKWEDWKEVLPLLKLSIEFQIADRKRKKDAGEFVPAWKNFKTWINNRCWEEETPEKPAESTSPILQSAECIVDHNPARDYRLNGARLPIYLCTDCQRAMGGKDWGKMSKLEIERAVEQGKRRPPPVKKDPERVTQDKKRVGIAKLTTDLGDKMKG